MVTPRSRSAHKVAEAVEACADLLFTEELAMEVLPLLEAGLGASGSLLFHFEGTKGVRGGGGSLSTEVPRYAEQLFAEDPVQAALGSTRPGAMDILAGPLAAIPGWQHSAAYCDFYRPLDIRHIAAIWLTDGPYARPGMTGLLVSRGRHAKEFSRDDAKLLYDALPALRAVARRERRLRPPAAVPAATRERPTHSSASNPLQFFRFAASTASLVLPSAEAPLSSTGIDGLTPAETRVLAHLACGLRNSEIAGRLFISVETVRTHVRRILSKLGVASRTQAALLAREARIADDGPR